MSIEKGIKKKLEKDENGEYWEYTFILRKTSLEELQTLRENLVKQRDSAQTQVDINNNMIAMIDDFIDNELTEKITHQKWSDVETQAKLEAEEELTDLKQELGI